MTDWLKQRRECKRCHGFGYIGPARTHGPDRIVTRCECQPRTMLELEEAAAQEQAA